MSSSATSSDPIHAKRQTARPFAVRAWWEPLDAADGTALALPPLRIVVSF
jgi:hypothetical protein